MTDLEFFIEECERELISKRKFSENTLYLFNTLSARDKNLCEPIISYITNIPYITGQNRETKVNTHDFVFLPKERILVCRLIPLLFSLNTDNPAWSSYMLTKSIESASTISGIDLSEIGSAFLEVFCEFSTPLNRVVQSFCLDFTREFAIHYRSILNELESLAFWGNEHCQSLPSVAYLKYMLARNNTPEFIFKTTITLLRSDFFNEFIKGIKYLFEDFKYKEKFQELLLYSKIPGHSKSLIFSALEF